ncbi:MAG: hypothetical protein WCI20_10875 [bacterium]
MKAALFFLLLLGCAGLRVDAQSTDAEVKGSQALQQRLGDPASWRIAVVDVKTLAANQGTSATKPPEIATAAETEMISIDRAKNILRCTVAKSADDQETYWFVNDMIIQRRKVFQKRTGSPNYFLIPPNSEIRPPVDFSQSDFPELHWIENLMSSGRKTVNGILCYIFMEPEGLAEKATSSNSTLQAPTGSHRTRAAYIDIANARPVLLIEGGRARQYSYPTPPQSIEIPAGAKDAEGQYTTWHKKTFPPQSKP